MNPVEDIRDIRGPKIVPGSYVLPVVLAVAVAPAEDAELAPR